MVVTPAWSCLQEASICQRMRSEQRCSLWLLGRSLEDSLLLEVAYRVHQSLCLLLLREEQFIFADV